MKILAYVAAIGLAACGGSSSSDPCKGVAGPCTAIHAGASHETIQTALIEVTSGTTIAFEAGTYDLDLDLSLTVPGVTIQGQGQDNTILSFKQQTTGAQGLFVNTTGTFAMHDIAIEDAKGDCLKAQGVVGLTLQHVRTEWTGGPKATNGAYGIYPVRAKNVLIENCVAKGASDTGIYVGQSEDVIVRNNDVESNVAGIEIENTTSADVHDNLATHNTGGILVFNLPGLQVMRGTKTRIYDNQIVDNNTENFAPEGNIIGKVPRGSGIVALAAHEIEIFGNTLDNHKSMNLGIASYTIIGDPNDPSYDVYPDTIYIHDNTFKGTSTSASGPLGALVLLGLGELTPPTTTVPDIVWDGVVNPAKALQGDPKHFQPEFNICIKGNGDADFADLAYPNAVDPKPTTDLAPHDCTHAPLPAVTFPGA
jgi:parallel beta-helix repeat protein